MLQTLVMLRKPVRHVRSLKKEGHGCNIGLVGNAVSKKPTRMLEAHDNNVYSHFREGISPIHEHWLRQQLISATVYPHLDN